MKGTVKGRYTVGAVDNDGKVIIDDHVRYNTDPRVDPSSTDMLGIVANKTITIADNNPIGGGPDFTVMAALFSFSGAVEVENLNSRALGTLYSYGGWTVQDIKATTNSSITKGLMANMQVRRAVQDNGSALFPYHKIV